MIHIQHESHIPAYIWCQYDTQSEYRRFEVSCKNRRQLNHKNIGRKFIYTIVSIPRKKQHCYITVLISLSVSEKLLAGQKCKLLAIHLFSLAVIYYFPMAVC
jgi:hypothetical protein